MAMRTEPNTRPVPAPNPNAAIERCADYLKRIHFWIQLWSVLSLIGMVLLFLAFSSSSS
jgi:hypothetical protein